MLTPVQAPSLFFIANGGTSFVPTISVRPDRVCPSAAVKYASHFTGQADSRKMLFDYIAYFRNHSSSMDALIYGFLIKSLFGIIICVLDFT